MNRALRAATVGVLLLSPVALTACSAGQVTQTATQDRDKVGGMAQAGDITIRAAELESPREGSYEDGDDAELIVAIVNSGQEADTLVAVEGEGFDDVEIRGAGASPAAGGATTGAGQAQGSGEIEIPADTTVYVDGDENSITLNGLEESLTVGQSLELTFVFENAGEVSVPVTVANPEDEVERGDAYDFHQEEGHGEEGTEDAARERESAADN